MEVDEKSESADFREGEILPYDLTQQDRIFRGRLPTLEIIQNRFIRMFRMTLSGALRKPVNMSIRSTELIKFGDFLKLIPIPSSLNLFRMNPLKGTALMILETGLIFNLVDIFYGGTGELEVKAGTRIYSVVEQRLIKRVVISALEDLQTAWRPTFPVQISYQRTEINPWFAAVTPQNEVVVVATFDIKIGNSSNSLTICIPYSMIEPVRPLLESGYKTDLVEEQSWEQRTTRSLKKARVAVVARKSCQPISFRKFAKLKAGDYILSDKKLDQPIDIYINGTRKMTGIIKENRGRQIVQIKEIFEMQPRISFAESKKQAPEPKGAEK